MCAEGKALAEGRIMKIDEKHKQMNRTKSDEWISVSPWGEQIGGWGVGEGLDCDDDDDNGLPW